MATTRCLQPGNERRVVHGSVIEARYTFAMRRRTLTAWLVALALFAGQALALAHTLSHLGRSDAGLPEPVCELCIAQADLVSATAASVPCLVIPPATWDWQPGPIARIATLRGPVPCARAPPAVV